VAVLRLRLRDSSVSRLGGWFGDGGNARGHASFGGSERHRTRAGGLDEADVVNQDGGWFL
jgi:hypothetical protein